MAGADAGPEPAQRHRADHRAAGAGLSGPERERRRRPQMVRGGREGGRWGDDRESPAPLTDTTPPCVTPPSRPPRLKEARVGPLVMFLTRCRDETPANARLAAAIVEKWSRPIVEARAQVREGRREPVPACLPPSLAPPWIPPFPSPPTPTGAGGGGAGAGAGKGPGGGGPRASPGSRGARAGAGHGGGAHAAARAAGLRPAALPGLGGRGEGPGQGAGRGHAAAAQGEDGPGGAAVNVNGEFLQRRVSAGRFRPRAPASQRPGPLNFHSGLRIPRPIKLRRIRIVLIRVDRKGSHVNARPPGAVPRTPTFGTPPPNPPGKHFQTKDPYDKNNTNS